ESIPRQRYLHLSDARPLALEAPINLVLWGTGFLRHLWLRRWLRPRRLDATEHLPFGEHALESGDLGFKGALALDGPVEKRVGRRHGHNWAAIEPTLRQWKHG